MTAPTIPAARVSSMTRTPVRARSENRSPFTGAEQIQDWGGGWWKYDIQFAVTQGPQARELAAALAEVGKGGRFIIEDRSAGPDPFAALPAANARTLAAAAAGAKEISLSAAAAGIPAGFELARGHLIQIGPPSAPRLHMATAIAQADAGGRRTWTIGIFPPLREAATAATEIAYANPKVQLRLDDHPPMGLSSADRHTFSISATEAVS